MKRYLILLCSVMLGLVLLAQTKMNFFFFDGGLETINVKDIDTIRFKNGVISVEGPNRSFDVMQVDSATFSFEEATQGDTVFVTYDGNDVVIDNPYSSILVTKEGANVSLRSSVGQKGVVYYLSGVSTEGSFSLYPDRGYTLVFDNLLLSNNGTVPPISLQESENGESFTASLHLKGKSIVSDGEQNAQKGALNSKSKLKINEDGSDGTLSLKGNKKHALNSSKRIELYNGGLSVDGAAADGINADGLEIYGGELVLADFIGDGVDCSEVILLQDGKLTMNVSAEDSKGLKCDSLIEISGGELVADVSGAGSKAVKSGVQTLVKGGVISVDLSATDPFFDEEKADFNFNAAFTSSQQIEISGDADVTVRGNGVAAKALNCDSVINVAGGTLHVDMNGADYKGEINGVKDTFYVCAIKASRMLNLVDGVVDVALGENCKASKGVKSDYVAMTGGSLKIVNEGGFYYTTSTSSNSNSNNGWGGMGGRPGGFGGSSSTTTVDATEPKGISGDKVNITGGTIELVIAHGKGISCSDEVTIGKKDGAWEDLFLSINAGTSNDQTYSKGGENSRNKYYCSPKAINCSKSVVVNSGTLDIVAYDSGIKGEDVEINGGKITISASYDQGIHGVQNFTVNGGNILVSSSYEAFEGVNMTFNGGITSIYSNNDGWNASTSSKGKGTPIVTVNGGYHYLNVNGNDTDVIDSNGSMSFQGGVVVCESNGNTLDCDASPAWNSKAKLMLFGSKSEVIPSGSTSSSYSTITSNTRYSAVGNGQVLASFTTTQTASKLIYVGNVTPTAYVGGSIASSPTEVAFRSKSGGEMILSIGGSVENSSKSSVMNAYSAEPMGGGGFGRF